MKDNKEIILIVIGLFIVFGLAFEPLKEASQKKSGSDSESRTSSRSSSIGGSSKQTENADAQKNIKNIEKDIEELEKAVQKQIEESRRSPFYNKIKMSNISNRNNPDPSREYIRISTNLDGGEEVNITGWYLKSEVTGFFAVIGGASLLPFPYTRNDSNVVLKDGDKAILVKGFSPIGTSFRTNKCTGYFEENRTFYPGLSKQCPKAIDDDLPLFSSVYDRNDECLDIIKKIPKCSTRGNEYLRKLPDTVPSSCKDYIRHQINYNSCVAKHFGDTDFPGNEYRIYLGKFGPLWRTKSDKINLHDKNGLVVDTIEY